MSVYASNAVWQHSEASGNRLLLLLALADNANDSGYAYPGFTALARKTRLSRSAVKRGIHILSETDELSVISEGTGERRSEYMVEVATLLAKPRIEELRPQGQSEPGVTGEPPGGSNARTGSEPSVKPSGTDGGGDAAAGDQGALPGLEPEPTAGNTGPTPKPKDAKPWQDADVQNEVWTEFVNVCEPKRKNMASGVRTLVAKALKEVDDPNDPRAGVETCKRAIHGLKAWRQQKPGEVSLSAIFRTRPGGDALADQIDFWCSKAGTRSLVDSSVPSVHRDRISRRRIQVAEMVTSPGSSAIREIGEEALSWLAEHAQEEPVIEGDRVTGWRKIVEAA